MGGGREIPITIEACGLRFFDEIIHYDRFSGDLAHFSTHKPLLWSVFAELIISASFLRSFYKRPHVDILVTLNQNTNYLTISSVGPIFI